MIQFLTSGWFGWLLTIGTLGLCLTTTVVIEFKWANALQRLSMVAATCAAIAVWFAIVVSRFINAT